MVFKMISNRCSLDQDSILYRCHSRRRFFLLLTLTILLSAVIYVTNFSFTAVMYPHIWLKVINKTNFSFSAKSNKMFKFNQQIQRRPETTTQTPVTTTPTVTKHLLMYHLAYPRNYQFILDEPDKCQQQNPFLVLMVPVAPNQLEARNAIRSTWGNESTVQGKTVMTIFVVGLVGGPDSEKAHQQLQEESQQHRDLVQSNFLDTYLNLTIKTMVIMDWLSSRCPQASYGMKVDSDMFLNVENLISLLLAPNTARQNFITGMVMWSPAVIRNKNSKWYVPEELYPEPNYPVYLLGMGYVFSNDLPNKFVEVCKDIKPFNIEDAYVGACLKRLGIPHTNPPDPSQFRAYLKEYKREEFARVITTILYSPKQLIEFWQDLKRST